MALSELERLQKQIGKRIKQLRAERKMKQKELAAECGLEVAHLSRIEAGGQNLTLKMLVRIAKALETEVSDFFQ